MFGRRCGQAAADKLPPAPIFNGLIALEGAGNRKPDTVPAHEAIYLDFPEWNLRAFEQFVSNRLHTVAGINEASLVVMPVLFDLVLRIDIVCPGTRIVHLPRHARRDHAAGPRHDLLRI